MSTLLYKQVTDRAKEAKAVDVNELYSRIYNGGMPALISKKYTDRAALYSSYISTYINRDVKDISGVVDSLSYLHSREL